MSKRGLFARSYPANPTLIMVKVWLPKGILVAAKGGNEMTEAFQETGIQTPHKAKPPICWQMGGHVAVRFVGALRLRR